MYLMSLGAAPHAVTEDDVYAGFFIPKGEFTFPGLDEPAHCWLMYIFPDAVVIGNTWWGYIRYALV